MTATAIRDTGSRDKSRYQDVLICVGDLMLDVIIAASRPRDAMPEGIYVRSGGSAANVAHWAQWCGQPSAWMGFIGSDPSAEMLLNELTRSGVLTHEVRRPEIESGVVLSWLTKRGHRRMHSARWAATTGPEHLPLEKLKLARAVHITGYGSEGDQGLRRLETLFAAARGNDCLLTFDPSHVALIQRLGPRRVCSLMKSWHVDVVFANRKEAVTLTGCTSAKEAAAKLTLSATIAIVKDGGRGSYTATSNGVMYVPAMSAIPVDTTGAGDAFAGAWLAAFLRNPDTAEAAHQATETASKSIRSIGGRPVD